MSGYESPSPEDEVVAGGAQTDGSTSDLDEADLQDDERPVDEAAARAHDVQPDDEKPVLEPDSPVADADGES